MTADFRERTWCTADGRSIQIKDMELGHLVNVLNWVHDNNRSYSDSVRGDFIKEAEYRKVLLFAEGKSYPSEVDGSWKIIDPETGLGSIQKPPEDYIEAVKDNELYQRMSKATQAKRSVARKQQS
jgi:hypothetical protein